MTSGAHTDGVLAGLLTSTLVLMAVSVTAGMLMDRSVASVSLTEDETLPEYAVAPKRPSADIHRSPIGMTICVKHVTDSIQQATTASSQQQPLEKPTPALLPLRPLMVEVLRLPPSLPRRLLPR